MSAIRIHDSEACRLDDSGRTPAFFCKSKPLALDRVTIEELTAYARQIGRDVRLCLHDGPQALFHDMLIAQHKTGYFRPHRHVDKGETWHLMAGEMAVFVFDEAGRVLDSRRLTPEGEFLYRVGEGQYHSLAPLSDLIVYHESKPGPFQGPGDSLFPSWAPDGSDPVAAKAYMDNLLTTL